nr:hypothetical protein [Tanacetum cinerariifolium]
MDLLSFIRTADPTKVRVAERQRVENKPRLLESTVRRVVPLLTIAPARASSELEASVYKLFDEGASGDGQGTDIQPVAVTTNTIVEDVAPEDCLEVLVSNKQSGNPTFSLHKEITSPKVIHEINDSKGCNFLSEELPDIDSFNDIHPHFDVDPLSEDSVFKDSIDKTDLANLDDLFIDPTLEMFTNEHAPDYSLPSRFDVYPDDFLEIESDANNFDDDSFDSKGEKIKESELLIDQLDLPCDIFSLSEYDSFNSQDFSKDDDMPLPNNEDKVFNPGILIHEKLVKIITRVAQEKKLAISYASLVFEDVDPPFYELLVFKDVPNSMRLLPFSSENEEKVFKPGTCKVKEYQKGQNQIKTGQKREECLPSSVSATPEREDKSLADSVTGLNLRTIGALQRFVISSDSSHHSGANIAEAEVDSIVRSSAPAITTVTIVTAMIDADATAARAHVAPSLFGVGPSSTGRTDSVPGGFSDVSGSDFLIGDIRTIVNPDSNLQKVHAEAVEAIRLWAEVFKFEAVEQSLRGEVGVLRDHSAALEREKNELSVKVTVLSASVKAEAVEAIRLWAEVFKFEAVEQSLRGEVGVLRDHSAALEREKNELSVKVTVLSASVKVHGLEISSAGLQEKVAAYEDFIGQLEKFQDKKLEEVNEKFDKLCAGFVDMALHLEEKFYSYLLTTICGRRWLLAYGMELIVVKFLNSTEYLSALGAVISKAVEKGMQEGLSAGITHGAEGRKLADVTAYNLSTEADYLSALQRLQDVNFSLIVKLKSNKDASVDTIMNLLRLDDVLAERLGLTESQPHVNQLMVPIHHSPDQRVVGASALSLSLEVSHSQVKKMRVNIAKHVSALRGVFVPLSEPFSVVALGGMEGTSGSTHDTTTTLSMIFVCASTISPISTDDYEVAHADGQGVPV